MVLFCCDYYVVCCLLNDVECLRRLHLYFYDFWLLFCSVYFCVSCVVDLVVFGWSGLLIWWFGAVWVVCFIMGLTVWILGVGLVDCFAVVVCICGGFGL